MLTCSDGYCIDPCDTASEGERCGTDGLPCSRNTFCREATQTCGDLGDPCDFEEPESCGFSMYCDLTSRAKSDGPRIRL